MCFGNLTPTSVRIAVVLLSLSSVGLFQCSRDNAPDPGPGISTVGDTLKTPLNYTDLPDLKPTGFTGFSGRSVAVWQLKMRLKTNQDSITNWGATLGRFIFYDKQLSANGTIACAGCHHQDKAFTDGKAFSTGFLGGQTHFSAMSTVNLGLIEDNDPGYFWDGRAKRLRDQVLAPFQDPTEMGMTLPGLIGKMKSLTYYPALFEKAYGSRDITAPKVADALNQFLLSLISYRSKFHTGTHLKVPSADDRPGEVYVKEFSELENRGYYSYVVGGCDQCHFLDGRLVLQHLSNGVNRQAFKDGKSKIPTLFNIALTAPYMHDGRFTSLGEVIDHYRQGEAVTTIRKEALDPDKIDKEALIAFLKTLTDEELTKDQRFSDPFKK
ncbi:cytochrome-c peroxidase [Larkinella soli]|uniref:cytochrome-c peroxidase n=1 Tax=Larkinella soli TaxID=1770527 RepID=UPI000FFCBAE5|nr:cytochrome c peroxidase [Larkinella soli]